MGEKDIRKELIAGLIEFCTNGHTPLSLSHKIIKHAEGLQLNAEELVWFKNYIARIRTIVRSKPGAETFYAFRRGGTHTSYSIMKLHGSQSPASYMDWLEKLEELKLLCRYDQKDDLEKWGNKKVFALNPAYENVNRIIMDVLHGSKFGPSI